MKKVYRKPLIMLENFTLLTSIAGDCEQKTDTPSRNNCGLNLSGVMVFLSGMEGCSGIQVDNEGGDGVWNTICYHVPSGGENNLFNS